MKLDQKLVFVCCLFGVALSLEGFSVTLPQSVEGVSGHCVLIPCSFTVRNDYEDEVKYSPNVVWYKGGYETENVVFDSSKKVNKLQGELIGDTSKKNCTTIFNSVSERDNGMYYFRIEGRVKYTFREPPLSINITASPPKPTLTLYGEQMEEQNQRKEVLEGSSVSLFCSAFSLCTSQPPTLTWRPLQNNSSQEQNQNSSFVSSHLNFTVTRLHHGLSINCTATYQLKNKEIKKTRKNSLTLRVLYAPGDKSVSVSPSGPVMWGSSVSLSCSSDGNPAVNYTWFRENGEQIETGPTFSITETNDTHSGLYYCRAQNKYGSQNSSVQLDVQYAPKNTSVSVSPSGSVMWGISVSLSCSSDGNPAVNYTWFRENGEQIETGPTFNITATDDTHSGLYYCRAQNQHGSQNSSVQLEVQFSPHFLFLSLHCNSSDNDAVMMICLCEVRGRPVPKLEWRLNEQPVSQSGSLSIKEESVGVSGLRSILSMHRSHLSMSSPHLQCVSTNQLGSSTLLFNSVGQSSNSDHLQITCVLIGAVAGAAAVILGEIYLCRRKQHKLSLEKTEGWVLTEGEEEGEDGDCLYSTKTIVVYGRAL
ncbi:sialic acid-binding Ig-like lectin 14 [Hoplias malabaricus]|uniref:sialic acid-binding Ig-like lectin 14 n=1 Tax=Hoplias malabaricus TaxID=27720 RepID=UPI003461F1CB